MSDRFFDVIVVGAGPAGSYTAYELASAGHDVAVFEAKSAVGVNVCCTGIISAECFGLLDPGVDVVLHKARSASFFSPSGRRLRLEAGQTQAYVVDRRLLDQSIATRSQSRGAQYFLSSKVVGIVRDRDGVQVEALRCGVREVFRARAVVLANGFSPGLFRKLGPGRIGSFLVGAQAEVEVSEVQEIEVYTGEEVAPGSFAWLVPGYAGRAYVGLMAGAHARLHLRRFVGRLSRQGRIDSADLKVRQKLIPTDTLARSYGNRLLVVGDAAGQAKPTTGGGIYFGHLGARMAAGVLSKALASDNLSADRLSAYQKRWKEEMGRELSRGRWARRVFGGLSDRQIERMFSMLDDTGMARALLRADDFSFDWHSRMLGALLRQASAYPLRKIGRALCRETIS
ncbi:MAG: NAD(P)/FAD-dependent oxidoreductase [Dehalococcoidia bacterium]|nr:NAD(P)/FAD-dependent oxidoreductase [Dehalococcoidia bacterium]